jgi:TetR/AcrR family transcriptional regulator, mexJK operon transcriptional repressor
LQTFGLSFFALLETQESTQLMRLLVSQAPDRPLMARLFYEVGPRRMLVRLAETLAVLAEREGLHIPEPERAAAHFICLIRGIPTFQREIGLVTATPPQEKQEHVRDCVEFFLRACRP